MMFVTSVQAAQDSLSILMQKFANAAEREAVFIEERYAFYLNEPIKIQGRLKAIPPDGLVKIILSPEPIRQVINGNRIQHLKNGVLVREISLDDQPALSAAINAMRSVLFGNLQYLQKSFEVKFYNQQPRWTLTLLPRSGQVRKQIKSIRVVGHADSINEFLVTEANGDYSKTRLYESQK